MGKVALHLLCVILISASAHASPPSSPPESNESDEIARIRDQFSTLDRRRMELVRSRIELSSEKSAPFDAAYREYIATVALLRSAQLRILENYADQFNNDFDQAGTPLKMICGSLSLDSKRIEARRRLLRDLAPHLTTKQLHLLTRLEAEIDAEMTLGIIRQVPDPYRG